MPADGQEPVPAWGLGAIDIDTPLPPAPRGRDRSRNTRPGEPLYGALDLGTNNCRLLIAAPARNGFRVVDSFSRIVRLGEGLSQTGRLSVAAQDRALTALSLCAAKLQRRGVRLARHVATEACRRASNTREFVARVYEETGIALDVISPQEEARLAALGCEGLLDANAEHGLVFDIGGGSTELVLLDLRRRPRPRIITWTSIGWGVSTLHESFPNASGRDSEYASMRACVDREVAAFAERCRALGVADLSSVRLLGTSGTVTTLASVYLGLPEYDRKLVDGCFVPNGAMRDIVQRLSEQTILERAEWACIGRERAELVVAGCAILDCVLEIFGAPELRVADRGIREGILRVLIRQDLAA